MTSRRQATDHAASYLDAHLGRGCALYFDDATNEWWVVSQDDLESLGRALLAGSDDAYSRWCSMSAATQVDVWQVVREWDIDAETDLDALAAEASDPVDYLALRYLQDEIAEQVADDEEMASECA